jgi:hypothetical protein
VVLVGEVDAENHQPKHYPSQKRDDDPDDVVANDDGDSDSNGAVKASQIHWGFLSWHWKVIAFPADECEGNDLGRFASAIIFEP